MNIVSFKIMSDLHMEFGSPTIDSGFYDTNNDEDCDVIIIAGDISNNDSPEKLQLFAKHIYPKPLLYVTGNHDYYRSSRKEIDKTLEDMCESIENFYFINHKIFMLNDLYIIGCTGWQNIAGYNSHDYPLNDFGLISDHETNIETWGKEDRFYLEETFNELKNKPVIVITHLPPVVFAINPKDSYYKGSRKMVDAYYNTYDDIIIREKPIAWICGHVHDSFEGNFHDTRIYRNAYGYQGHKRQNKLFDKNKIIKINTDTKRIVDEK